MSWRKSELLTVRFWWDTFNIFYIRTDSDDKNGLRINTQRLSSPSEAPADDGAGICQSAEVLLITGFELTKEEWIPHGAIRLNQASVPPPVDPVNYQWNRFSVQGREQWMNGGWSGFKGMNQVEVQIASEITPPLIRPVCAITLLAHNKPMNEKITRLSIDFLEICESHGC